MSSQEQTSNSKVFFMETYFEELDRKIDYLLELYKMGRTDEAFILCSSYIDGIALNILWPDESSKRCFVKVLEEYSKVELFSRIQKVEFINSIGRLKGNKPKTIVDKVGGILEDHKQNVFTPNEFIETINEYLTKEETEWVEDNMWRGTIASITYNRIRCEFVHKMKGASAINFRQFKTDETPSLTVDFKTLFSSLRTISQMAREISFQTGMWYGHDLIDYN
jgi:hypothetical protein